MAGFDGVMHPVIDFENYTFRPVLVMLGLVITPDDGERVHDVVHVRALDTIKLKKRGIEFALEEEPSCGIPAKRCASRCKIVRKRPNVPCSVGKLDEATLDPGTR